MYWPVGPPRIFELQLPAGPIEISEDGVEEANSTPNLVDQSGLNEHSDDADGENSNNQQPRDSTSMQPTSAKDEKYNDRRILSIQVSRNSHFFATCTRRSLTVWQTKPTAVLATVIRSPQSLDLYGQNISLLLRPDAEILVVRTEKAYLITYSLERTSDAPVYRFSFKNGGARQARRRSVTENYNQDSVGSLQEGGGFVRDISLRFRMVIRLDAGISSALALDNELLLITKEPAAVQSIRWTPDRDGTQTNTELLSGMDWLEGHKTLVDFVYDRPMSLFAFVSTRGRAYAAQRISDPSKEVKNPEALLDGHIFHTPTNDNECAVKAAINSKFSMIAIGCADGSIFLYSVRNYAGGVRFTQRLISNVSDSVSGRLKTLQYSPDGYCLFVGYEKGWTTWSVFGQAGTSSFQADRSLAETTEDYWLLGINDAAWVGGGSELIVLDNTSDRMWQLEFARSAVTGCFTPANVAKGLLLTSSGLMVYLGHQMPDLTAIASDVALWQHIEIPNEYLIQQWPMRSAVISPDGRYIAVAGQRGLAHYSLVSGRWKTFTNAAEQNEFMVRGGMCWHHHVLIVAVETKSSYELRLYSRELPLEHAKVVHVTILDAPVVHLAPSSGESLLVYTYENVLDHYIISASRKTVKLVKVGQIALNGIIRAPPRVRAVSWIVPDDQIESGDPSKDVALASVIFLVDGKLVLLQPSSTQEGDLKYDMRVISHRVEQYLLVRDAPFVHLKGQGMTTSSSSSNEALADAVFDYSLQDSMWAFDGENAVLWPDVKDLLVNPTADESDFSSLSIRISLDFYPFAPLLQKGILFGAEADLTQRRDSNFSYFRAIARTTLFLPSVLRYYLERSGQLAALNLSEHFRHLSYFAHALEILLHDVLDEEVEKSHGPKSQAANGDSLLSAVLDFLSIFPEYLDIIVQCARKTELRSWRTLFANLPPPNELFEASLNSGALKTAGGYLLVLHSLAEIKSTSPQVVRLLKAAKSARDWELCKELARFLMALDETGDTLREALELVDTTSPMQTRRPSESEGFGDEGHGLGVAINGLKIAPGNGMATRTIAAEKAH